MRSKRSQSKHTITIRNTIRKKIAAEPEVIKYPREGLECRHLLTNELEANSIDGWKRNRTVSIHTSHFQKKKKTFDLTLHPPRWHAIYSKVSRARIRERKREKEEDEGDMALLPGRPTRPEIRNSRSFLLRDWSFGQRGFRLRDSLRTYYPLYKSIPTYI